MKKNKKFETALDEAKDLIFGERASGYGSYLTEARRLAKLWGAILGVDIPPRLVPLMMVQLKIVREIASRKHDNIVDGAGYFGCLEKLYKELDEEDSTPILRHAQECED